MKVTKITWHHLRQHILIIFVLRWNTSLHRFFSFTCLLASGVEYLSVDGKDRIIMRCFSSSNLDQFSCSAYLTQSLTWVFDQVLQQYSTLKMEGLLLDWAWMLVKMHTPVKNHGLINKNHNKWIFLTGTLYYPIPLFKTENTLLFIFSGFCTPEIPVIGKTRVTTYRKVMMYFIKPTQPNYIMKTKALLGFVLFWPPRTSEYRLSVMLLSGNLLSREYS